MKDVEFLVMARRRNETICLVSWGGVRSTIVVMELILDSWHDERGLLLDDAIEAEYAGCEATRLP